MSEVAAASVRVLEVDTSPHINDRSITTRGMMRDVLIGLLPALAASVIVFGLDALRVLGICIVCCLAAEWLCGRLFGQKIDLLDCSAAITGVILALSLPGSAPWWVCLLAGFVAISLGKAVFGGLGFNIFNPAMVGRAFVMLSFAGHLGAPAYIREGGGGILTQATPLSLGRELAGNAARADLPGFFALLIGNINGSLGETSALALFVGGIYLCARRSASWELPASAIATTFCCAGIGNLMGLSAFTAWDHLAAGSFLLGAFFIITDPVSSPLTRSGKFLFGAGFGLLVVMLRLFSSYPEGVMFAVLLMNACAPLINRLTIPRPLGGAR